MAGTITKDLTVNECIKKYPDTIGMFNKFNIDSCCGGAVSLEEAAKRDGANLEELLKVLNKIISYGTKKEVS